jgi:hypothetical protein
VYTDFAGKHGTEFLTSRVTVHGLYPVSRIDGDTILNFPAAEQSAVNTAEAFIDPLRIEASASLHIDLYQYHRVSLSGGG